MKKLIIILWILLLQLFVNAQNPYMISVNPYKLGCDASNLINLNGTIYFLADDGLAGLELWKTNGTITEIVKDINGKGTSSFNAAFAAFTIFKNNLFFVANDAVHGFELWRTDAQSGAILVKDIATGSDNGIYPSNNFQKAWFTIIGDKMYFVANDGTNGNRIWETDGTTDGTKMCTGTLGPDGSDPSELCNVNGVLFFSAYRAGAGFELWKYDGTTFTFVKDIWAGVNDNGFPTNLCNVNGTLYFTGRDGTNGRELWKSDGTEGGTVLVKDINSGTAGSNPDNLINLNGTLVFIAKSAGTGYQLWKSDGTADGTVMIKNIYEGNHEAIPPSGLTGNKFTIINNILYFQANNGTNGLELWKTNGTTEGTVMIKDIFSGTENGYPSDFVNIGGVLYFSANNGTNGFELWKTNGTPEGTVMAKDIWLGEKGSAPSNITAINNTLFFTANDEDGLQVWKLDGTEATKVKIIRGNALGSVQNINLPEIYTTNANNIQYLALNHQVFGCELWKTDCSQVGTVLVKDIWQGNKSSFPSNQGDKILKEFVVINNIVYFIANDGIHGNELWKSDGTKEGTALVKDIAIGAAGSNPKYLTKAENTLYFAADDGMNGIELWKSDGTEAGTVMVKDIYPGSSFGFVNSSEPQNLLNINDVIFFTVNDGNTGRELWKVTNTTEPALVKDIYQGGDNSFPDNFINYNSRLYFIANNGTQGVELWKSDGTADGTVMVKEIFVDPGGSNPKELTIANGYLFFQATDGQNGIELWRTDGTENGTIMVKDIVSLSGNSYPHDFVAVDNVLYFIAYDNNSDVVLWKTSGTFNDVQKVIELQGASRFFAANNTLYFVYNNTDYGNELWKLDINGIPVRVTDIASTTGDSNPENFKNLPGAIFFTADDGLHGRQLWVMINEKPEGQITTIDEVTANSCKITAETKGYNTTVMFDFGTFIPYESTVIATPSTYSTPTSKSFQFTLNGLLSNTVYHIRMKGENPVGTFTDVDKTIITTPASFNLSAPIGYCAGNSVNVTLSGSETNVSYQLYNGNNTVDLPLQGTGNPISWSGKNAGTYKVEATHNTTHKTAFMNGTPVVVEGSEPNLFSLSAPTYLCSGKNATITLSGSQTGANYQLKKDGVDMGELVTGTGQALTWQISTGGIYTAIASQISSSCSKKMTGDLTVELRQTPSTPVITNIGNILTSNASTGNQWYMNDGSITNATSSTYNATTSGNYHTIVTINNCVSEKSNVINIVISTGIEELKNIGLDLYPNPSKGILILKSNDTKDKLEYWVIDINGKILIQKSSINESQIKIDLTNYAKGFYLIKIKKGEIIKSVKIIIE